MPHTGKQVKTELAQVCLSAVSTFLLSTRGAHIFGARAKVTQPQPNRLQVHADDGRFFEIIVKEAW